MPQGIAQAMALHANRKKCENLIYGSVKTKQKRLDALARIEKEKRREADRSTDQLVYTDAPIDAAGCLAVEEKKRESDGHVNIRWSHFDYNLRSYNTMGETAAQHNEFKIGVSTCPLWRMYFCTGHGSMIAHVEVGWVYMYVVACKSARVAGALESGLITHFRHSKYRNNLRNTRPGADGFSSRSAAMYYVYIIAA